MKCHACKTGVVTQADVDTDGPDAVCSKCIDRKHQDFMKRMQKIGIKTNCVQGCKCGFGK